MKTLKVEFMSTHGGWGYEGTYATEMDVYTRKTADGRISAFAVPTVSDDKTRIVTVANYTGTRYDRPIKHEYFKAGTGEHDVAAGMINRVIGYQADQTHPVITSFDVVEQEPVFPIPDEPAVPEKITVTRKCNDEALALYAPKRHDILLLDQKNGCNYWEGEQNIIFSSVTGEISESDERIRYWHRTSAELQNFHNSLAGVSLVKGRINFAPDKTWVVAPHGDDGMRIDAVTTSASYEFGHYTENINSDKYVICRPGSIHAYKKLKKEDKEISVYDMFVSYDPYKSHVVFSDGMSLDGFIRQHATLMEKIGYMEIIRTCGHASCESLFMYLSIVGEYPSVEQLVKAGYVSLYQGVTEAMKTAGTQGCRRKVLADLDELVNGDATKSSEAMRFPKFLGNYLQKKNADLEEYRSWRNFYELTGVTDSQFEKLMSDVDFVLSVPGYVGQFCSVYKYGGYTVEKLAHYIAKQTSGAPQDNSQYESWSNETKGRANGVYTMLGDYLNMCTIMETEADRYPQNLKLQHDRMSTALRMKMNAESETLIHTAGTAISGYVGRKLAAEEHKTFEDYALVVPESTQDLINEGMMQNNCVGSYGRRVAGHDCYVFFIRKKGLEDRSYITCDCTEDGLNQCLMSNNRACIDASARKFAEWVAKQILEGTRSGHIPVFADRRTA